MKEYAIHDCTSYWLLLTALTSAQNNNDKVIWYYYILQRFTCIFLNFVYKLPAFRLSFTLLLIESLHYILFNILLANALNLLYFRQNRLVVVNKFYPRRLRDLWSRNWQWLWKRGKMRFVLYYLTSSIELLKLTFYLLLSFIVLIYKNW